MTDYIIDGTDQIFNIWEADKSTRLYKNEMLRNHHLCNILTTENNFNNLLDVGCGTGYLDSLLAKTGKKVTAVDISQRRLDLFKDISKKLDIIQINENLYDLEVANFDAVISQEVLEHLEDYESALLKMSSFLKPKGIGLFCVPYNENLNAKMIIDEKSGEKVHKNGHLHSFTKDKFEGSILKSGFEIIRTYLLVNKRSYKRFSQLGIPINNFTLKIDDIMNKLFPHKAAYLAILCRKK